MITGPDSKQHHPTHGTRGLGVYPRTSGVGFCAVHALRRPRGRGTAWRAAGGVVPLVSWSTLLPPPPPP
eukprot:6529298-Pyramimonas_sp.AAC.1